MLLEKEWTAVHSAVNTFVRDRLDEVSRKTLSVWSDSITEVGAPEHTMRALDRLNRQLGEGNAIVFFDHQYAFDAFPACLILRKHLTNLRAAIVPYAVHLELGVDPEGNPSTYYQWRTKSFNWIVDSLDSGETDIRILPVEREFERSNPRIKALVDYEYPSVNLQYIKQFKRLFSQHEAGVVCVQAPMGGLALPGKPLLSEPVYKLIELVQRKSDRPLPCYLMSAYPKMLTDYHYFAPLLTKHTFVADGPFRLENGSYGGAISAVEERVRRLREAAVFHEPDYARIQHK